MMQTVKSLIKTIPGVKQLLEQIGYYRMIDYSTLTQKEKETMLMDKYERLVGYRMDLNNPVTYTEKLQWYKLFYEGDGDLLRVVDKYLFKDYIKEKLGDGYTVPLFGVYESLSELEDGWDNLPEEFVLKSTLSSDGKNIKFIHNKSNIDFRSLKKELKNWFKEKYLLSNGFCQAYRGGTPRVIAEQYLENIKDQLFDYKFYCFGGEPFCCCVNTQHFAKGKEHTFPITYYDIEWNKIDVKSGIHETEDCECPKHYQEMIDISRKLSKDFPHVRVDFFDTDNQLYLSELTLYSGGGYFKYHPESFNVKMGNMFILSTNKK